MDEESGAKGHIPHGGVFVFVGACGEQHGAGVGADALLPCEPLVDAVCSAAGGLVTSVSGAALSTGCGQRLATGLGNCSAGLRVLVPFSGLPARVFSLLGSFFKGAGNYFIKTWHYKYVLLLDDLKQSIKKAFF